MEEKRDGEVVEERRKVKCWMEKMRGGGGGKKGGEMVEEKREVRYWREGGIGSGGGLGSTGGRDRKEVVEKMEGDDMLEERRLGRW